MTRDESCLLTPYNTASLILQAWQAQDWPTLYDLTAREGENGGTARAGEQNAFAAFAAGRTLTGYTLSPGNVSFDGQRAVLTVSLETGDQTAQGYPLMLLREEGIWKMDYTRLINMMNGTK